MTKSHHFKRALALSTALSVVALGATTTAADAALDPGKSQGKSQGKGQSADKGQSNKGKAKGQDKSQDKSQGKSQGHEKKSSPAKGSSGKGEDHPSSNGHANGNGQSKDKGPRDKGANDNGPKDKGPQGAGGDPAGNNGTVKITPHGEVDGIPQNTPHVGCDFDVEWYGFDEGADIISTVTFEAWSPTRGQLEVTQGDLSVFVGGDPASGAGTDSGFDGEEHYTLAFPGIEPHPKQGYHVKLTIHTPGSQGADTKHKVFWVSECEDSETPPGTPETPETPEAPETPETPEVEGEQGTDVENDVEVLGAQAQVNGQQGTEALPTAVDAGVEGTKVFSPASSLPLMLTLFGAIVAGLALLIRRRTS